MTRSEIDEAVRNFVPGVYRHYKGGMYRAISLVAHHESREPWVLYVSLKQGSANIRPLKGNDKEPDGWLDSVEVRDEPAEDFVLRYKRVPRFLLVNANLDGVEDT